MHKLPFNHSPRLAARFARLHKLKRRGLTPPTDKASQRQAASDAAASHAITVIPASRFVTLCDPDERLAIWHNRIIILSPRKPPDFLNTNGSREPVIMLASKTQD